MRKILRSLLAGLTAMFLLCGLLPVTLVTAAAAEGTPNLILDYQKNGEDYTLALEKGGDTIYGLQVELKLSGNCPDAVFVPESTLTAFTPECRVDAGTDQTLVTIYMSAEGWTAISNAEKVRLGTLRPRANANLASDGTITLLDRDLKPFVYANKATLTVRVGSVDVPTDPGEPSNPGNSNSSGGSASSGTSSPALRPLPDRNPSGSSQTGNPSGTTTQPTLFFTDVPATYWTEGRNAILWASENGFMNGTSATTFQPDGRITRQAMWMILARLNGVNPANMAEARTWAVNNAISDGTNPTNNMSRQQMVTFLYRYAQQKGYQLTGSAELTTFPDNGSVSAYAQEPLAWAVANSIVAGTSQGTLNPTGTATRAQFAVILQRFYNGVVNA